MRVQRGEGNAAGTSAARGIEKFSEPELAALRAELLRPRLDSWQAAELTASFLAGHGYGSDPAELRLLIGGLEMSRCSLACLQSALERVASVQ
jgi:hypothetical protein